MRGLRRQDWVSWCVCGPPTLYDRGQFGSPRAGAVGPKPQREAIKIGQEKLWQDCLCQPCKIQPEYLREKRPVGKEHRTTRICLPQPKVLFTLDIEVESELDDLTFSAHCCLF